MNNKLFFAALSLSLLVGSLLGWFTKACSTPKSSFELTKDTVYVTRTQLEPAVKDSTISFKRSEAKREDKVSVKDSSGNEGSVIINTEQTDTTITQRYRLAIKPVEIIRTEIKEITNKVIEYVPEVWYSNNWFWLSLLFIITTILGIIY